MMTEPRTPTGKRLAEGHDDRNPFVARLLAIEDEAASMERVRLRKLLSTYYRSGKNSISLGPPTACLNLLLDDYADLQEWPDG